MNFVKESQLIFRSQSGPADWLEYDGRVAGDGMARGIRRAVTALIAACGDTMTAAARRHRTALRDSEPIVTWTTSS